MVYEGDKAEMSTAGASGGAAGVSGDTGGSGSIAIIACVTGGEIHCGETGEIDGQ